MTPSATISQLLNHAQKVAIASLTGLPASKQNLQLLSDAVHSTIMNQVAAGLWEQEGIKEAHQIAGLRVSCSFGNTLIGEPPIKVNYDFAYTSLKGVVVQSVRGS